MGKRWTRKRAGKQWGVTSAGAVAASPWTTVTLDADSLMMDPMSIISSATYGAVSSITFGSGDPGCIRQIGGGTAPDCAFWTWEISDNFHFGTNAHIAVQLKITSTPDLPYLITVGVCDGTDPPIRGDGLGASIQCDDGATGNHIIGDNPTMGNAAANISAAGGMLSTVIMCNKDNDRMHYVQTKSTSDTGPADGRQSTTANPSSWSGTEMHGFLAIGNHNSDTSRAGGTFAGIELRYQVLVAFD